MLTTGKGGETSQESQEGETETSQGGGAPGAKLRGREDRAARSHLRGGEGASQVEEKGQDDGKNTRKDLESQGKKGSAEENSGHTPIYSIL